MEKGKDTFILYGSQYDCLADLTDEQLGQILRNLYLMRRGEPLREFTDTIARREFNHLAQQVKYDSSKYAEIVKKRKAAGIASVKAKQQNQHMPTKSTHVEFVEQNQHMPTKSTHVDNNVYDNDNVNDNDIIKRNIKEKDSKKIYVESLESPWKELTACWLSYKSARKESYKNAAGIKAFLAHLKNLSRNDPAVANEIINQSIANNYQGIFELKKHKKDEFTRSNSRDFGRNDIVRYEGPMLPAADRAL